MAKLIVVEGLDGAGKTTLCDYLYGRIPTRKKKMQSEPSDTLLGQIIRESLNQSTECINREALERYFWMDRDRQAARTKDLLRQGYTVIQSRSIISGFVYGNTPPESKLSSILNYPKPDMIIYLECTPKLAYSRIKGRGSSVTSVYESSEYVLADKSHKFNKVLTYFAQHYQWKVIRVGAQLSPHQIYKIVTQYEDLV